MKTRPQIKSVLCSALLLLALLFSLPARQSWRAAGQNASLREPFLLELPDLGNQQITAPEVAIPKIELHKLRLRIRKPFADAINYGRIYTRVNGEAAVTIQNSGRDSQGQIVVTLDLDKFPRFNSYYWDSFIQSGAWTNLEGKQVSQPIFELTGSFSLRIPDLGQVKRPHTPQNRK
jgi:hypothetical protein